MYRKSLAGNAHCNKIQSSFQMEQQKLDALKIIRQRYHAPMHFL